MEHELLTLPEHMSSRPFLCSVRVTRSLVVCVFCRSLFFPFVLFLLVIVLSVPLIVACIDVYTVELYAVQEII